ncbi:MAG: porin [Symploca sp. SIO2B6]|nr:porin [Symploca sp. SIO2B6]
MAMNLIIPNYHQLSVQNRQLWINLPATGLVAILWALGVSSIQPAQASVSKQETTSFEPTQTHQQTNFPQSPTQAPEVLNSAFVATEGNNSLNLGQLTLGSEFGCINEKTCNPRIPKARSLELPTNSNQTLAQLPQLPQPLSSAPVPTTAMPMGVNGYNQGLGQYPNYPQTVLLMPMGANGYNQGLGQYPNYPQTFFLMPATAMPMGANGYNQGLGQYPNYPQNQAPLPPPLTPNQMGTNGYNQGWIQYPNYPQNQAPLPITPNQMGTNGYNQGWIQYPNYPQNQAPLPITPNQMGTNGYNQGWIQYPNYPQNQAPLPITPNQMGTNGYNQGWIQYPNYPQNQAPLPITPNQVVTNGYNQGWIQYPNYPQNQAPLPVNPNPNFAQPLSTPTTNLGQIPPTQVPPEISSKPINSPSLSFQGSYITQGEDSVARARLSGIYPVTPQILFGATFDLTSEDNELADSPEDGFNINELYLAAAPFKDLPNLRFVVGQLDLTSYFDRNSFAKDGVSHFFNSVFQTNPALSATGIASRTGALVNWSVTDNIEAKAAVFSSDRALDDFDLDGFAGEIGLRFGNAIVRGTYATARDAGSDTGFQEIFSLSRGDNDFGLEPEDREESYGINAEVFIPNLNMGLFARYGRYENRELDEGADTYSLGLTFLDVFAKDDRLGLAYGRGLSNERLRQDNDDDLPDVLELFYDFRFLRNLRLGVTLQQRDNFSDTFAGFRIKTDFDLIRRRRGGQ